MDKKILVINAGSSSIKFQVLKYNDLSVIAKGLCERIRIDGAFKIEYNGNKEELKSDFPTPEVALKFTIDYLLKNKIIDNVDEIVGVGNRVVHGGTKILESCVATDKNIQILNSYAALAPLHVPPELDALKILQGLFKNALHVAVLDTTFHTTIPPKNYMYGVKDEWLEKYEVRRFGFHGISYQYINEEMKKILNKQNNNLIVCHLGSGSSICAIKDSKSVSTSMGFSAIDGLIMCTRTGDISPYVIDYMSKQLNKPIDDILNTMMKESGLKGMTGFTDMRDVEKNLDNTKVKKGFDAFIKRIVNFIVISLNDIENKIDGLVFCGGIGENSPIVREAIINELHVLNIKLDKNLNEKEFMNNKKITTEDSPVAVYVVNTNEECMMGKEVKRLIEENK